MGPKIKLTYFNLRARAEISRIILAQAGVEYEDCRVEREDWPALKKTIPFGQIPMLEFDGTVIIQSMNIARFLAREFNLSGKNNLENAVCDMYVDCTMDFVQKAIPIFMEKDAAKKAEKMVALNAETLPNFLTHFTAALKKNGGKYLVGDGVTLADIGLANMLTEFGSDWKPAFPELAKHAEDTMGLPNIKKWLETRPHSDM